MKKPHVIYQGSMGINHGSRFSPDKKTIRNYIHVDGRKIADVWASELEFFKNAEKYFETRIVGTGDLFKIIFLKRVGHEKLLELVRKFLSVKGNYLEVDRIDLLLDSSLFEEKLECIDLKRKILEEHLLRKIRLCPNKINIPKILDKKKKIIVNAVNWPWCEVGLKDEKFFQTIKKRIVFCDIIITLERKIEPHNLKILEDCGMKFDISSRFYKQAKIVTELGELGT